MSKLIVGIDPGTTTSVSILSLKGEIIDTISRRNFGQKRVTDYILRFGKPSIVATDKSSVPKLVEKISSSFDAAVYKPDKDLTVKKKNELTREHEPEDSHQKDSLAAGLNAFNEYRKLLQRVETTVDRVNLNNYEEEVKDLIIRKKAGNVSKALDKVLSKRKKKPKPVEKKSKPDPKKLERRIKNLNELLADKNKIIKNLESYKEKLENRAKSLESEKEGLKERLNKNKEDIRKEEKQKLRKSKKDFEKTSLEERKNREELEKIMRKFQKIEEIRKDGLIPVKFIPETNLDQLEKIKNIFGLKGDVIYFQDEGVLSNKILKFLKKNKIRAVVGGYELSGVNVLKKSNMKDLGGIGYIKPSALEEELDENKFMKWLRNYRRSRE